MEKAYQLSEKLIEQINNHSETYMTTDGKSVHSEDMINSLNNIIESGLVLYKYLQEHKYYEGIPTVTVDMIELSKLVDKMAITESNAKKLDMGNALQIWNQMKIIIAKLACDLLDHRDELQ